MEKKRIWICPVLMASVQAFVLCVGHQLSISNTTHYLNISFMGQWALLFVLFSVFNHFVFKKVDAIQPSSSEITKIVPKRILIMAIALFVMWFPVFLAYYPTLWAYDVYNQVPITTGTPWLLKHPIFHTMYIQGLLLVGKAFGSYEIGMVLMSMIQMIIMSGIFAYCIELSCTWFCNKQKVIRLILLSLFGLSLYHSIMSISQTKDVLFSGFCVLLFTLMADIYIRKERHTIGLFISIIFMLSFRNNAIYAYIPWLLIVLFITRDKKYWAKIGSGALIVFLIVTSILGHIVYGVPGPVEEAYSVPMQCLTGAAIRHKKLIPEYGKNKKFYGLVSRDLFPVHMEDIFYESTADTVKHQFITTAEIPGQEKQLLLTWLEYSLKYPHDTFDIWAKLEMGAWYPLDTTHAYIYSIYPSLQERQGYLLTDYKNIEAINMPRPLSKLPKFEALLEKFSTDNIHQNIPGLNLFFAPATYIWIVLYALFILLYKHLWKESIPILFLVVLWGTILLSPCIVIRYMYPIMSAAPFVVLFMLKILKTVPLERN